MIRLLVLLLVLWAALSIAGFIVEGLIWLAIVGLILFAATSVFLWVKRKATGSGPGAGTTTAP